MPRWLNYLLLAVILLLLVSIPLAMQVETGMIQGIIMNDRGPVAGASLEARNVMSGAISRAESNAAGAYKVENLRAGRYSMWVQAAGHDSAWIREVIVERGRTTRHDIRLARIHPTTGL